MGGFVLVDVAQYPEGGHFTHFVDGVVDGGQFWRDVFGKRHVVVADKRQIVGDAHAFGQADGNGA